MTEPKEAKPQEVSGLWDNLFDAVRALTEAGEVTWTPWTDGMKTTLSLTVWEDEDEDDKSVGFVGVTPLPQFDPFDPASQVGEAESFQHDSDAAEKLSHFVLYNEDKTATVRPDTNQN